MPSRKNRAYLAHPIKDRLWVRPLELWLEKEFEIELHNPFYDGSERKEIERIDRGELKLWQRTSEHDAKIVEDDLQDIVESNSVLMILTKNLSFGCPVEMKHAYEHSIPVYTVALSKLYYHPFVRYFSTKMFKTVGELVTWMIARREHNIRYGWSGENLTRGQ